MANRKASKHKHTRRRVLGRNADGLLAWTPVNSGSAFAALVPGNPDDGGTPDNSASPEPQPSICEEAHALVYGDRNKSYGHPRKNFTDTAAIWSVILGVPVTPEQVGLCMIGVKLARQSFNPKRDNLVDIAGYATTVDRVTTGA